MACAICKHRREKRHCPGIQGEICAICCGEQREESIACPFECPYLEQAHERESLDHDPAGLPNRDFPIPKNFLDKNVELLMTLQHAVLKTAIERGAVDSDAREALGGLVRTYQTMSSGLYYESRPANPIAAAMFDAVQARVAEIRKLENERGVHRLQDSQILTVLVFLQHLEYGLNNGRKRGRSFLHNLLGTMMGFAGEMQAAESAPLPLILS